MKNNNEGFTLVEILIVVAIIAALVAIAIPVISKQVEKANEAYDIATMRQAASLSVEFYYDGVVDKDSAEAHGLKWWDNGGPNQDNAAGVYDPATGEFLPKSSRESTLAYGKGTETDGGTVFEWGDGRTAYRADLDYRNAVVMVAIYPTGDNKHIDVYWKYSKGAAKEGQYVGGQEGSNNPKYSIRIELE